MFHIYVNLELKFDHVKPIVDVFAETCEAIGIPHVEYV